MTQKETPDEQLDLLMASLASQMSIVTANPEKDTRESYIDLVSQDSICLRNTHGFVEFEAKRIDEK